MRAWYRENGGRCMPSGKDGRCPARLRYGGRAGYSFLLSGLGVCGGRFAETGRCAGGRPDGMILKGRQRGLSSSGYLNYDSVAYCAGVGCVAGEVFVI